MEKKEVRQRMQVADLTDEWKKEVGQRIAELI